MRCEATLSKTFGQIKDANGVEPHVAKVRQSIRVTTAEITIILKARTHFPLTRLTPFEPIAT